MFFIVLFAAPFVNVVTMYINYDSCVVHQVRNNVEVDCSLVGDARRNDRVETVKREWFYPVFKLFKPLLLLLSLLFALQINTKLM